MENQEAVDLLETRLRELGEPFPKVTVSHSGVGTYFMRLIGAAYFDLETLPQSKSATELVRSNLIRVYRDMAKQIQQSLERLGPADA